MNNKVIYLSLIAVLLVITSCVSQGQPVTLTEAPATSIYATSISVGGAYACALLNNGRVLCWGDNSDGQLGDGTYNDHGTATEVINLPEMIAISAGGGHTCALANEGTVKCWGQNDSGQLGIGTKEIILEPVDIPNLVNVTSISAGFEHTCAVINDGSVKCWGKNLNGRVGNGSNERLILSPTDVVELGTTITFVSAGNEHTCALTNNGDVKCWGRNVDGELGIGQDKNFSKTPMDVLGLEERIVALTTGFARSCAVTDKGKITCWGWIGFQQFSIVPVDLAALNGTPTLIASGGDHICVVVEGGKVNCIGENEKGQLGNGNTTDSQKFVEVKGLPAGVTVIGASFDYTCALTEKGEVWCWGHNASGQLGDGTKTDSSFPVKVIGISQ